MTDDAPCICGHPAADHHMSYFPGGILYEECEFFGFNETGGAEFVDGKWIDHCMMYHPT